MNLLQQQVGVYALGQCRSCVDNGGISLQLANFQVFTESGCNLLGTVDRIVYTQGQQHIGHRTR